MQSSLLFLLALRSLNMHKLRSSLTVLGLVFGVSSVIVMLAIAEGVSFEAQRQIESLGVRNIIVRSKKPSDEKSGGGESEDSYVLVYGLTYDDLDRIQSTIPTVVDAVPLREFMHEARYQSRSGEVRVVGVDQSYREMNGLTITQGRFINALDLDRTRNVCVIGSEIADELFPYESPFGKTIRVGESHFYRIIGTTAYRAPSAGTGSSLSAQDYNRDVYIPLTTDRARFGSFLVHITSGSQSLERIELSQITVKVAELEHVKSTAQVLQDVLAEFHERDDFSVTIPLELLEKAEETKRIFNLLLGSTAGISLLVGGIGIMNIMLATVTERTREIGIRRALGARRADIILQFMVETTVLSLIGGVIGVIVGIAVPQLVTMMSGRLTIITYWAPAIALLVAVSVGIIFGVYPARRAAYLDPIEALRSE